ncbi:MAG: hypothetical protein VB078_12340 [Clostridiaceae bacterium]|nr:hypothetical protein [Clostridiaceae bacterium]
MKSKREKIRAGAAPEYPAVQLSIFGRDKDANICPFCCTFLSLAGGGGPKNCPLCGQPIIYDRRQNP